MPRNEAILPVRCATLMSDARVAKNEHFRIGGNHPTGDVDLLELHPRAALVEGGNPDAPEPGGQATGPKPSQVRFVTSRLAQVVELDVALRLRVFANEPGRVVVPVNERCTPQEFSGVT